MNAGLFAERQYGLITRAQAAAMMSESAIDRRLANGRWVAVLPGVYRVAGTPVTGRQRAMAAVLWAGTDSAISHSTGARLLRLRNIPFDGLHLTVPRGSGLRSDELMLHRAELRRIDRVTVDGIACTSASRTLIDCASLVDGETLEAAFEHARQLGLTSVQAMRSLCVRGRRGSSKMRQVLAHASARPKESRLEVKLARLLRESRVPTPEPQVRIGASRVDFAWRRYRLVCECDGFEWHGDRLRWKQDRRRIAAIEAAGWRVVHVTWEDVTRYPIETIDRLALALGDAA